MGLRLVPKSVTLNDLEWRNGHYFVSVRATRYTVTFAANCVKFTAAAHVLSATKMQSEDSSFCHYMIYRHIGGDSKDGVR